MAKLAQAALLVSLSTSSLAFAAEDQAMRAFRQYWQNFDAYEKKTFTDQSDKFQQSWKTLSEQHDKSQKELDASQLALLKETEKLYIEVLAEHSKSNQSPYVYLNLVHVKIRLADHYSVKDESLAQETRDAAITIFEQFSEKHPDFANRDEALYLQAYLLGQLGRQNEANRVWTKLAKQTKNTMYGVHAALAMGDTHFRKDEAKEALASYQKAIRVLNNVDISQKDYEKLRIQYRIAWAAYRSADLKTATETALMILTPGRQNLNLSERQKMDADAIDLLANTLYENDNINQTLAVLKRKELIYSGPGVALRIMRRYTGVDARDKVIAIGKTAAETYPTNRETPLVLSALADAYGDDKEEQRLATLEKLALMLPPKSLWRTRHQDDFAAIKAMEDTSLPAAEKTANFYYQKGLATGNVPSYIAASSFYDLLLQHDPTGAKANEQRMRIAHCYFFADKLEFAESHYRQLMTDQKLTEDMLRMSLYQLALTREKRWRYVFAQTIAAGKDPSQDGITVERLRFLEESVEEYANRFPKGDENESARAVDLLLMAAAANRDHESYSQASRFWERSLVSQPTRTQRAIAIRGLVLSTVKTGKPADVVALTSRFLTNEATNDWEPGLSSELKAILAKGLVDESENLNQTGDVDGAGSILVEHTERFKDLPDWDRLNRDGAYLLAIAGNWSRAETTAQRYLDTKRSAVAGDMAYLLARSSEYQLRFGEAAQRYLVMGTQNAAHPKAQLSLERAEKLSDAENNWLNAAKAAQLQAERTDKSEVKVAAYARAIDYYEKAKRPDLAQAMAKDRIHHSRELAQRLDSELLLARAQFTSGNEKAALQLFAEIERRAEEGKSKLAPEIYARILGETNFQLGEEKREVFEDYSLAERRGKMEDKLLSKMKMFESMSQTYDKATKGFDPEWSARSRYMMGEAAEKFAHEVTAIARQEQWDMSPQQRKDWEQTAKTLQAIAKKAHSTNVLNANVSEKQFRDNVWVKKSNLKLTGLTGTPASASSEPLPPATGQYLPNQWSL